jgi:geranylgeranyl pyrophosphate synthase
MNNAFLQQLAQYQQRIEQYLDQLLPSHQQVPQTLHQAIRYAVLNNAKRIRPTLVYASGEITQTHPTVLDRIAASIELIHCYSLVHDDLPAIDNDDLRRGKPTCHKAFDEATAILVGDALQNLAFQILTEIEHESITASQKVALVRALTHACGTQGMVGGQAIDIAAKADDFSLSQLERMHHWKTGALFAACIELVLITHLQLPASQQQNLRDYAQTIGLLFQVVDDILDVGDSTDVQLNKATFPALLGLAQTQKKAQQLHCQALAYLEDFGASANFLRELTQYLAARAHSNSILQ